MCQPRQPCEVLGEDRVALVRHRRRPLLPLGEEFLRLAHFGALQVADFGRQPLHRGRDDSEGGEEHRVPVAGDDLRRDRFDGQPEPARDVRLHRRVEVGEGSHRAGDGADRDLRSRRGEALAVAGELGPGLRHFQPEGRRLGVHAVAAADAGRAHVFARAALQRGEQRVEVGEKDVGGAGELHGEAGVEHVRRCHAAVHEARLVADMFCDVGEKGDDVVPDLAFDGVDARDLEAPARRDGGRHAFGDRAQRLLRLAGVAFDIQPDAKPRLRGPDRRHRRARVARDHRSTGRARRVPGPAFNAARRRYCRRRR